MRHLLKSFLVAGVLICARAAEAAPPDWKQVLTGLEAGGTTFEIVSDPDQACRVWATLDSAKFETALPLMSALHASGGITPEILQMHRIEALVGYAAFVAPTIWLPAIYATRPKLDKCAFTAYIRGKNGSDHPVAVWDFTRALYRKTDWAHQATSEPIPTLKNFELLGHAHTLLEGRVDLDED